MRIEETFRTMWVVLPTPVPNSPEEARFRNERVLVIQPPVVYVEYDRNGRAIEYRAGGASWVA